MKNTAGVGLYYLHVLVLPSMAAGGRPRFAAAMLVRLVSPDPVCSRISPCVLIIYVGAVLHYLYLNRANTPPPESRQRTVRGLILSQPGSLSRAISPTTWPCSHPLPS